MKVLKWLDEHLEESLLVVLLVLIACVELVQVVFRNLSFVDALTWPEEFCRFAWIWSVFLSLPFTIRKASMLRVSVLTDMLPQTMRKIVNIAIDLINAAVMATLFYYSIEVIYGAKGIVTSGETSPAMNWPMWIVYISMLIGFGLAIFRALQMAVVHVKNFNVKELTTLEQTMADAAEEAEAGKRAEGGKE